MRHVPEAETGQFDAVLEEIKGQVANAMKESRVGEE
jgi:hypothetical protein